MEKADFNTQLLEWFLFYFKIILYFLKMIKKFTSNYHHSMFLSTRISEIFWYTYHPQSPSTINSSIISYTHLPVHRSTHPCRSCISSIHLRRWALVKKAETKPEKLFLTSSSAAISSVVSNLLQWYVLSAPLISFSIFALLLSSRLVALRARD